MSNMKQEELLEQHLSIYLNSIEELIKNTNVILVVSQPDREKDLQTQKKHLIDITYRKEYDFGDSASYADQGWL